MQKRELVEQLGARREALGLTHAEIAERCGLTERSVRNALGERANPQLSSLLALVDALGLELQLAPRGFGGVATTPEAYRPVATRIAQALSRPAGGDTSPPDPPMGGVR
jgi:HTH-type transcriptional regulator/antitoxin HipB